MYTRHAQTRCQQRAIRPKGSKPPLFDGLAQTTNSANTSKQQLKPFRCL
jgi:hypothetical protein